MQALAALVFGGSDKARKLVITMLNIASLASDEPDQRARQPAQQPGQQRQHRAVDTSLPKKIGL